MRIASNSILPKGTIGGVGAALFVALGIWPFIPAGAYAAESVVSSVSAPVPSAVTVLPVAAASASIMSSANAETLSSPSDPVKAPGEAIGKNIAAMEDKVSENAKNVVKRLDTSSDATSFADLNSARQTITRIEAMIDVEKRLSELEKLRRERGEHISAVPTSLAAAIPASALMPLPQGSPSFNEGLSSRRGSPTHLEIARIYGTQGRYTAILKLPGGDIKTVKAGDRISSGETVRSISASSVEIGGSETSTTLHIKNVDVIYSAMR